MEGKIEPAENINIKVILIKNKLFLLRERNSFLTKFSSCNLKDEFNTRSCIAFSEIGKSLEGLRSVCKTKNILPTMQPNTFRNTTPLFTAVTLQLP